MDHPPNIKEKKGGSTKLGTFRSETTSSILGEPCHHARAVHPWDGTNMPRWIATWACPPRSPRRLRAWLVCFAAHTFYTF